jgi:hypothetical protein
VNASSPNNVTELLRAWSDGDLAARDQPVPLVYRDLRRRAGARLKTEWQGMHCSRRARVHEAYLRLLDQNRAAWQNRSQFFAVARR